MKTCRGDTNLEGTVRENKAGKSEIGTANTQTCQPLLGDPTVAHINTERESERGGKYTVREKGKVGGEGGGGRKEKKDVQAVCS